jgi:protein-tyrosine phosphatase
MRRAAQARGLDMTGFAARQFEATDFTRFDLILAMDAQNLVDIEALRPVGNATQVALFADRDVPDPYYTGDFEGALNLIEAAATAWV